MPPYSSRTFSHRALVPAPTIEFDVEDWQTALDQNPPALTVRSTTGTAAVFRNDRVLTKLTLRKGKNFPTEYRKLQVLYGRNLYWLKETADRLELAGSAGAVAGLIRLGDYDEFRSLILPRQNWQPVGFGPPPPEETMTDVFQAMFYPLLARSLDLTDQLEVEQFALPPDRAHLLIYAPLPATMTVRESKFTKQDGFVLYSLDVFEPESR
jgi:hypothetical protein